LPCTAGGGRGLDGDPPAAGFQGRTDGERADGAGQTGGQRRTAPSGSRASRAGQGWGGGRGVAGASPTGVDPAATPGGALQSRWTPRGGSETGGGFAAAPEEVRAMQVLNQFGEPIYRLTFHVREQALRFCKMLGRNPRCFSVIGL